CSGSIVRSRLSPKGLGLAFLSKFQLSPPFPGRSGRSSRLLLPLDGPSLYVRSRCFALGPVIGPPPSIRNWYIPNGLSISTVLFWNTSVTFFPSSVRSAALYTRRAFVGRSSGFTSMTSSVYTYLAPSFVTFPSALPRRPNETLHLPH